MRRILRASMATLALPALILAASVESGLKKGEFAPAFEPRHVTGPDANTDTCPVCKYGLVPGVQVWVNGDSPQNVEMVAAKLESAIKTYGSSRFKAFVIYIKPESMNAKTLESQLKAMAVKARLKNVALTYLDSPSHEAVKEYSVNTSPQVKNTVFVYANRQVIDNLVNLKPEGFPRLMASIKTAVAK